MAHDLDLEQQHLNDLRQKVEGPMFDAFSRARRAEIHAQITPASLPGLMTYLNLFHGLSRATASSFLVQRDPEGWSVHRLIYKRVEAGLQRVDRPADTFELLPDSQWFREQLRAFVEDQQRQGIGES